MLARASPLDMPTVIWRALLPARADRPPPAQVEAFSARRRRVTVRSIDGRPLPLQVDGDHIGDVEVAEYSVRPGALTVVA